MSKNKRERDGSDRKKKLHERGGLNQDHNIRRQALGPNTGR